MEPGFDTWLNGDNLGEIINGTGVDTSSVGSHFELDLKALSQSPMPVTSASVSTGNLLVPTAPVANYDYSQSYLSAGGAAVPSSDMPSVQQQQQQQQSQQQQRQHPASDYLLEPTLPQQPDYLLGTPTIDMLSNSQANPAPLSTQKPAVTRVIRSPVPAPAAPTRRRRTRTNSGMRTDDDFVAGDDEDGDDEDELMQDDDNDEDYVDMGGDPSSDDEYVPAPEHTNMASLSHRRELQTSAYTSSPATAAAAAGFGNFLPALPSAAAASGGAYPSSSASDAHMQKPSPSSLLPPAYTSKSRRTPAVEATVHMLADELAKTASPAACKEEQALLVKLGKQKKELRDCQTQMEGLNSNERKRLRNCKASRVSRLRKKLAVFDLQRNYEALFDLCVGQTKKIQQLQSQVNGTAAAAAAAAAAVAGTPSLKRKCDDDEATEYTAGSSDKRCRLPSLTSPSPCFPPASHTFPTMPTSAHAAASPDHTPQPVHATKQEGPASQTR